MLFVTFAASTALILFLAANTSFNAFPRLAAILAEDGYMPRQFSFRGDRLAYSWGIVLLAAVAFGLLWAFGGDTHALIPLYSVGVFVCFTLSQIGMVKHWFAVREQGWRWRAVVNAAGAVLTAVVLVVVVSEKFLDGAYLVVILVPLLVGMMLFINAAVRPLEARAGGRARTSSSGRRTARSGSSCRSRASTGRSSRPSTSAARSATTSGPSTSPTTRPGRQAPGRLRAADPGRPAGRRRVAVPGARRAAARLPRRARRGLAAGQAGADHVRRHPRVRRPQLVGADPLQPGRQAAADGAARAAAHGRRRRARTGARTPALFESTHCGGATRTGDRRHGSDAAG